MKRLVLITTFFTAIIASLNAQTLRVEGKVNTLSLSDCGDCNGGADPRIKAQVSTTATPWSGEYRNEVDDVGCSGNLSADPGTHVATGVGVTEEWFVRIRGFESDGFICSGDDGDCDGFGPVSNYQILPNYAPSCSGAFNTGSAQRTCSSGGTQVYTANWQFRYHFEASSLTDANAGGTITFSNAADTAICSGATPGIINGTSLFNDRFQSRVWQVSINGAPFTDISGQTGQNLILNALTNNGSTVDTYAYRRKLEYCTSFSGGTTSVFSNTLTIIVRPSPSASISGTASVCTGGTATVTITNNSPAAIDAVYSINGGGNVTSNIAVGQADNIVVNTTSTGTFVYSLVSVAYQSGASCSLSASGIATITVTPGPSISITGLNTTYCQNASQVALTGFPSGGTFDVDGTPSSTFDPPSISGSSATITYNYTDPTTQCSSTTSQQVTLLPAPQVTISGLNPTACLNSVPLTLTGFPAGGSFSGNGVSNNQFFPNLAGLGVKSVSYSYTDANGCVGTANFDVDVQDNPSTVDLGNDTVICVNLSVTLDAGANFTTYTWNTGQTTSSISVSQSGIYSVEAVDANGCINTDEVAVTTAFLLNPIITSSGTSTGTTFCEGEVLTLDAGNNFATYLWSDGQTTTSTFQVTQSGQYSVFATDASGCSGQSTPVFVTVLPAPNPTITTSGPAAFCPGSSVTLCGVPGYVQYQWSTGETSDCITVNTEQSLTLTVTDNNGCTSTSPAIQTSIHQIVFPEITVNGPTEFCKGGSVDLSVQPIYASYLWNSGSTTPDITVTESGIYVIDVLDINGCITSTLQSDPITVTVNSPYPQITVAGPVLTTVGTYSTYQWYEWQNTTTSVLLAGETNPTFTATYASWFYVMVTDAGGCVGYSDTFLIRSGVGVEEYINDFIQVYPNPANTHIDIRLTDNKAFSEDLVLKLVDNAGKVLLSSTLESSISNSITRISLENVSQGNYFLHITGKKSPPGVYKITKL